MNDDEGGIWKQSTEGDLDPDLTEEAGYAGWDPPNRDWMRILVPAVTLLLLLAFALSGVLVFLR